MLKSMNARVVRSAAFAASIMIGLATCALAQDPPVDVQPPAPAPATVQAEASPATKPVVPETSTDANTVPADAAAVPDNEPVPVKPAAVAARSVTIAPDFGASDFLLVPPSHDTLPREPADSLLMRLLGGNDPDSSLHRSGLVLSGHAQGGYTYNPNRSSGDVNFGRVFDDSYADAPQIDQLALSVHRRAARDRFDVGGRVEVLWGYDTFRFHSNGLDAYGGCNEDADNPDTAARDPRNQFDLTQAYLDLNFEVGTGLLLRVGKFVTPLGYETIDPTTTPFYSRSYLFGFAKPFTHTGVLLNYRLDDHWEAWGGVVRGWDQSLKDTNGSVSFLGRLDWRPDPRWNVRLGVITGHEGTECDCGCPGNDANRTLVDLIITHAVTDRFGLGVEALYGRGAKSDENNRSAEWYGVAAYASYKLTGSVRLNARGEWFRDQNGTRLETGSDIDVMSATLGLSITPFSSSTALNGLTIQPEIRYDHATTPEFDGGTSRDQVTLGIGVLYSF